MRSLRSWLILAALTTAASGCGTGTTVGAGVELHCDAACSSLWSLDLGGVEASTVNVVGSDGAGNVIFEANLEAISSDAGAPLTYENQAVLAKLDPAGQLVWKKVLPAAAGTPLMSVGAGGDIVLFGTIAGGEVLDLGGGSLSPAGPDLETMYVAAFDASGNHLMSRALHEVTGDPSVNENYGASAQAMALDPSGAIVVAGDYWGPLDLGGGALGYSPDVYVTSVFVMKLDPSGALLWSEHLGDQPHPSPTVDDTGMFVSGVTVDPAGSILLGIELYGTVDFGAQTIASAGSSDIVVAKLDPSGGLLFAEGFGGPGADVPSGIAAGPDGAIFFTGLTVGTVDFGSVALPTPDGLGGSFVTALEPDGQVRWSVLGPSLPFGAGAGIAVDGAGGVEASFYQDEQLTALALTRLDPATGAQSHARTIALAATSLQGQLQAQSFAVDPLGNVVLGGGFHGVVDFGTGPLSMNEPYVISGVGTAAFLVKVAP